VKSLHTDTGNASKRGRIHLSGENVSGPFLAIKSMMCTLNK
jgi:hypothetical protein